MKGFLVKTVKMESINLKCVFGRALSQSGGDVMEEHWLVGRKKKISEMSCAERAYIGCRNPTTTSRQRQALMLMISRQ